MTTRSTAAAAKRVEAVSHERDFFVWTQQTAALLRVRRFSDVDAAALAEEVEDMGKRDLRELHSRSERLLVHLLKWQFQKSKRSRSWKSTILTQRFRIQALLDDSPSLRPKLLRGRDDDYARATQRAAVESGLKLERFPSSCPYTLEQLLDTSYLPA
jgi:Domain of unknown function DUF29